MLQRPSVPPPRRLVLWLILACTVVIATENPNIVILFADNLGYADVGFFASDDEDAVPSRTPNIDRIGRRGMAFDNWNSAAHLCSASRAALLTGKYPVRTGVYPGVFRPDAANGLSPNETTLAEYLRPLGYATAAVGKWHLGHRPDFLPTNQGFEDWLGVPYHMSGGSLDNHTCVADTSETMWLPLYEGDTILQQPVRVEQLAMRYVQKASDFIHAAAAADQPFLLYVPFSHVHQLCAPRDGPPEQASCQWSRRGVGSDFVDAVAEMDWIVGQILNALERTGVVNDTLVLFTSDNGPWVAEQACAGKKGPFRGQWLADNVPLDCTACPHDFVPSPTPANPRRCVLPGAAGAPELSGVHCGEDSGLGSMWEANLRMPALAQWPGRIPAGARSAALVSTLDVLPTVLALVGVEAQATLDGVDISAVLSGGVASDADDRVLFLWRDGFRDGPLPPPFGRMDVVGVKIGRYKIWYSTKSAHYNDDPDVRHDPPLMFDVLTDPAEAYPLDSSEYEWLTDKARRLVRDHKATVGVNNPLTLERDARFIPCADRRTGCRTEADVVATA